MESKTNKMLRLYIVPIIFIIIGVVVFFISMGNINKMKTYDVIDAEIIDILDEYDPAVEGFTQDTIIKYTINGKEYTKRLGSYNSSYEIGKTIEIYCSPTNPDDILPKEKSLITIGFIASGVTFVAGLYFLISGFIYEKKSKNEQKAQTAEILPDDPNNLNI